MLEIFLKAIPLIIFVSIMAYKIIELDRRVSELENERNDNNVKKS